MIDREEFPLGAEMRAHVARMGEREAPENDEGIVGDDNTLIAYEAALQDAERKLAEAGARAERAEAQSETLGQALHESLCASIEQRCSERDRLLADRRTLAARIMALPVRRGGSVPVSYAHVEGIRNAAARLADPGAGAIPAPPPATGGTCSRCYLAADHAIHDPLSIGRVLRHAFTAAPAESLPGGDGMWSPGRKHTDPCPCPRCSERAEPGVGRASIGSRLATAASEPGSRGACPPGTCEHATYCKTGALEAEVERLREREQELLRIQEHAMAKMDAEIDESHRLRAERDSYKVTFEEYDETRIRLRAEADHLRSELRAAADALDNYGAHTPGCIGWLRKSKGETLRTVIHSDACGDQCHFTAACDRARKAAGEGKGE